MQDVTPFSTERPKDLRVTVIARDPDTGKSRSVTVYGITPDQFIEAIKSIGARKDAKEPATSAA